MAQQVNRIYRVGNSRWGRVVSLRVENVSKQHYLSPMVLQTPKLDKPGAGLPLSARLLNRLYYGPWVSKRADWDNVDRAFIKTNMRILEMVKKIPREQLEIKILVPPMQGLEDSSRFWSVAMTLEHIEFVGRNIAMTIIALSKGNQPPIRVNIANLKPKGLSKPEIQIELFEKYATEIPKLLASEVQNRNSRTTLAHPWFGRFNAGQWHWLLAAHSRIHLPQLIAINQGLA